MAAKDVIDFLLVLQVSPTKFVPSPRRFLMAPKSFPVWPRYLKRVRSRLAGTGKAEGVH
jgi:hypothetical protein